MKNIAECPVCSAKINFSTDTIANELIACPECGSELEVISVNPPELAEAPQEEEDWGE